MLKHKYVIMLCSLRTDIMPNETETVLKGVRHAGESC